MLDVPAGSVAEAVLGVPAARRGWLDLGRVMLETRYPLGLFRAWSYLELEARALVYPRPERAALPPFTGASSAGMGETSWTSSSQAAWRRLYHS